MSATLEPYTDSFAMGCGWPVRMKVGDGSTGCCEDWASWRVTFENGGRTMLCAEHAAMLSAEPALPEKKDPTPSEIPNSSPPADERIKNALEIIHIHQDDDARTVGPETTIRMIRELLEGEYGGPGSSPGGEV